MNTDKFAETFATIGIAAIIVAAIIVAVIIVAVIIGALSSCKTPQPIVQMEVKEVIVELQNNNI